MNQAWEVETSGYLHSFEELPGFPRKAKQNSILDPRIQQEGISSWSTILSCRPRRFSSHGQFYVSDCKNSCQLRVYDEVNDFRSKHIDNKTHLRNFPALEAAVLVLFNRKLCIVKNKMGISLAYVSKIWRCEWIYCSRSLSCRDAFGSVGVRILDSNQQVNGSVRFVGVSMKLKVNA